MDFIKGGERQAGTPKFKDYSPKSCYGPTDFEEIPIAKFNAFTWQHPRKMWMKTVKEDGNLIKCYPIGEIIGEGLW